MSASWLHELQSRYGEALDEALLSALSGPDDVPEFYGMMRYQLGYVDEQLRPIAPAGGKRFRPLLALLACEAAGGDWHDALGVAVAVELLHNFSLIHDDIEDRDPIRRHRPTVWAVWQEPQAINVGDAVFALSMQTVLGASKETAVAHRLAKALTEVSLDLTTGQYLDMCFESRLDVSAQEYLRMIERKTASIIAFSVYAGSLIGGSSAPVSAAFIRYGSNLGKAFQIHDDIMGIWGTSEETGKRMAQDLHNRKKTLPVLLALERADPQEVEHLRQFMRRECDDVGPVQAILENTGAHNATRGFVDCHLDLASQALHETAIEVKYGVQFEAIGAEVSGYRPVSN